MVCGPDDLDLFFPFRLVSIGNEQKITLDDAPVLNTSQPDFWSRFEYLWTRGIPVVIPNSLSRMTLTDVGKDYFMRCYGQHRVRLVDCNGKDPDKKTTLQEFLSQFGVVRAANETIWKLKVFLAFNVLSYIYRRLPLSRHQDWPPSEELEVVLRELHEQVELTVPVPDISRADGVFNFASLFATNANKPDLGEC